jgi:hypothetical protein
MEINLRNVSQVIVRQARRCRNIHPFSTPTDDPVAEGLAVECGCDRFQKRRPVDGRERRRGATAPVDRAEEGLASPLEIELSADSIECRPTASGAGVGAPRGKAPTAATLPGPPASLGPRGA